jgi:hypothetical protein
MPSMAAIKREMRISETPRTRDPRMTFEVTVSKKTGLVQVNGQPVGDGEVAWASVAEHFGMQLAQFAIYCKRTRQS